MIESIVSPERAEKKPWEAFIAGFIFTFIACLLTLRIDPSRGGFLVVAFISIAAAPFFVHLFDIEEKKGGKNFIDRHDEIIKIYAFFFLSVIFASSLFYVLVAPEIGSSLFSEQVLDLCSRGIASDPSCTGTYTATASAITPLTGEAASAAPTFTFLGIFLNNVEVLILAFIFSFMLGAGAVFLISWNATIIGVLVAKIAENPKAFGAFELVEGNIITNYVIALPYTLLRLLPHGIFEFGGYFFGAVAGGILSVAIVREKFKGKRTYQVFLDSLIYLGISFVLVLIGALIEVAV